MTALVADTHAVVGISKPHQNSHQRPLKPCNRLFKPDSLFMSHQFQW
jgi:hypothetical protein